MKNPLLYKDRQTGETRQETIYFESMLRFLYETSFGRLCARIIAFNPWISYLYGKLQSLSFTKRKIEPFVKKFELDESEFEKPLHAYCSFNDFFTRKLKPESRPLANSIILPADGRYLCYQNIEQCENFLVKGKQFALTHLLRDETLAETYKTGSMIIARLCPADYHRFHFPCDCVPSEAHLINGPLYSVNPLAIKEHFEWLIENKRMLTRLKTDDYGEILFIEIGATCVGSIHQTYIPGKQYKKGDEKGYFSFGGSSVILLFQPGTIQIDSNLLINSSQNFETLCLLGQPIEKNV